MIKAHVRSTLVTILTAAFPGAHISIANGDMASTRAMETVLTSGAGWCIAIQPIIATKSLSAGRGTALQEECELAVLLRQNPDVATDLDHDATVTAIQLAVLGDNATRKTRVWGIPSRATLLDPTDSGNLSTDVFFTATVLTS